MSIRKRLISKALDERFRELCDERIPRLGTAACAPVNFFLRVRQSLSGVSPADARNLIARGRKGDTWAASGIGCRRSLLSLALGDPLEFQEAARPPLEPFLELLNAARSEPGKRAELLADRYAHPLNFNLSEEAIAREHVLTRLMTHDRARIERDSVLGVQSNDLLLKLNLVALHAAHTSDLRFLDALNYYYELLPTVWPPKGSQDALLASYHALYAQALAAWM